MQEQKPPEHSASGGSHTDYKLKLMEQALYEVKSTIKELKSDVETKHGQNRSDIHIIKSQQQDIIDTAWRRETDLIKLLAPLSGVVSTLEKMSAAFDNRCAKMETESNDRFNRIEANEKDTSKDIQLIKLQIAKMIGWAAGVAVASATISNLLYKLFTAH